MYGRSQRKEEHHSEVGNGLPLHPVARQPVRGVVGL